MKFFITISFIVFLGALVSCDSTSQNSTVKGRGLSVSETVESRGIMLPVYDFEGFRPLLSQDNDTLYIINFWATWCKPCVRELPYFEQINKEYSSLPVRVILVSLDFRPQLEELLIPFMTNRGLKSEVMVLHDPDANAWIGQVDKAWSGAIPATLFIRGNEKWFFERSFTAEELKSIVESKLNQS